MEFKLKQPLQVMNKKVGEYQTEDKIEVKFVGRKGLKALKSLQDIIFKTFLSLANSTSEEVKKKRKDSAADDVKVEDILSMLEMGGDSERVIDSITDKLKSFARIGESNLTEQLQDEMDLDDLENLCQEVLKNFLLPKIIQKLNNSTK